MTNTIKLRPIEESDLPYIQRYHNDQPTMAYWFEEPFESMSELQKLYEKHILDQTERRFLATAPITNTARQIIDRKPIGIVELIDINQRHRHAEIQIIVDKEQGHGYAQEMFSHAIDYAFKHLNLNKVYLYVDVDNKAAIHIYEKFGFQIEGTLKQHFFADGQYHDVYYIGLLQDDWRKE